MLGEGLIYMTRTLNKPSVPWRLAQAEGAGRGLHATFAAVGMLKIAVVVCFNEDILARNKETFLSRLCHGTFARSSRTTIVHTTNAYQEYIYFYLITSIKRLN